MDKLWAPWRLDYILQEKDGECFLCNAVKSDDDRNHLLLKRGKTCGIILNRYPYNNGHLMVFPYRHIDTFGAMTPDERLETMDLTADAIDALKSTVHPDGFNIGINLGQVAGAGLKDHIHTHIVPRWNGDTNFMPVTGDTKVIPQFLLELWDQLHPILSE